MSFRWGTYVQYLHTLFLQPHVGPGSQANASTDQRKGNAGNQFPPRSKGDKSADVCQNYKSDRGCSFEQCKFKHNCMVPGCSQGHAATLHSNEIK